MTNKTMKTFTGYFSFLILIIFIMTGYAHPACAGTATALIAPDKIIYPPLKFNLPQVQRVVLENGIVLNILEDHELPLVNVNAMIKTGTMYDPAGLEGVAELTAYVMRTGGTAKLNSDQIDNQIDFMAASASIAMSMESAQVNFSILNNDLDHGLDLLSQILIHPVFEQEKFELARRLIQEELRRTKDDPQKLAFREFNRLIYHNDTRGRFPTNKSLSNIERDDLIKFHDKFFIPGNIIFSISGDITKEEAVKKFNQYFGDWKAGGMMTATLPPPQQPNAGVYFIDKEIAQSILISGRFAPGKKDPDFYAFTVLDFIVGSGGFPSRIVSVVRNSEGLAYTSGSFYRAKPAYGVFGAYAFTKTSSTLKALSLIDSVLDNIPAKPITAQELDWAKNSIDNGFIFSFSTAEQIAWQQTNLEYDKLPADFLIKYRDNIDKVTNSDLDKIAGIYLNRTKNVVLILGDGKKFDKPLSSLGPYTPVIPED
ncbi:MAG TPA: pitrilysin family protein [Smithella sp.]|nr:pitrilysin family protein [Smithella sp.]